MNGAYAEEIYFDLFRSLVNIVGATGKGYAVWQEIIDNNVVVKPDTVVEVWKVRRGIENNVADKTICYSLGSTPGRIS